MGESMTRLIAWKSQDVVAATYVGMLGLVIAWLYYTGLYCSDDTRYLVGAIRIALGEDISTTSLAERRVALLIPAAVMYALTRSIDLAIGIYALFYVGLGLVAYALARRFFDVRGSVLAALLAAVQPALFFYSGALMPDIASASFLAVALYFLCRWIPAEAKESDGRLGFAAGAGASIAVAFTLKESSAIVVLIPAALVAVGLVRKRVAPSLSAAAAMLGGFAAVLMFEMLLFRFAAGHWYSSVASLLAPHDFGSYVEIQGRAPLARLKTLRVVLGSHVAILFLLAGVALVQLLWQCLRRKLSYQEAAVWLTIAGFWAWPAFYFTFGTASLTEYAPPVMQQRYYALCIVPAALLVARLIQSLIRVDGRERARLAGGLVAGALLLFFLSAPYSERSQRGMMYGAPAKEAFIFAMRDMQRRFPDVPVVDTDSGWTTDLNRCRALLLSSQGDSDGRLFEAIRTREDLRGSFGYADLAGLDAPYLIVGHGPLLSVREPKDWARELEQRIESGDLTASKLGLYVGPSYRDLAGRRWMPRELAVRDFSAKAPSGESLSIATDGDQAYGRDARDQTVEVYLISEAADNLPATAD